MIPEYVRVEREIKLDQFLKWSKAVSTGGQGKALILSGLVKVNGEIETRRGRILQDRDRVEVGEAEFLVVCC
mgnify:CR=1 FL=1|jgi:ribosome-associated protein